MSESVDRDRKLTKYEWESRQRYGTILTLHHIMLMWGGIITFLPVILIYLHHVKHMVLLSELYFWIAMCAGLVMLVKSVRFLWYDYRHGP